MKDLKSSAVAGLLDRLGSILGLSAAAVLISRILRALYIFSPQCRGLAVDLTVRRVPVITRDQQTWLISPAIHTVTLSVSANSRGSLRNAISGYQHENNESGSWHRYKIAEDQPRLGHPVSPPRSYRILNLSMSNLLTCDMATYDRRDWCEDQRPKYDPPYSNDMLHPCHQAGDHHNKGDYSQNHTSDRQFVGRTLGFPGVSTFQGLTLSSSTIYVNSRRHQFFIF